MRRLLCWLEYIIARILTDGPQYRVTCNPARAQGIETFEDRLDELTKTGHTAAHFRQAANIVRVEHPLAALAFEARAERL